MKSLISSFFIFTVLIFVTADAFGKKPEGSIKMGSYSKSVTVNFVKQPVCENEVNKILEQMGKPKLQSEDNGYFLNEQKTRFSYTGIGMETEKRKQEYESNKTHVDFACKEYARATLKRIGIEEEYNEHIVQPAQQNKIDRETQALKYMMVELSLHDCLHSKDSCSAELISSLKQRKEELSAELPKKEGGIELQVLIESELNKAKYAEQNPGNRCRAGAAKLVEVMENKVVVCPANISYEACLPKADTAKLEALARKGRKMQQRYEELQFAFDDKEQLRKAIGFDKLDTEAKNYEKELNKNIIVFMDEHGAIIPADINGERKFVRIDSGTCKVAQFSKEQCDKYAQAKATTYGACEKPVSYNGASGSDPGTH